MHRFFCGLSRCFNNFMLDKITETFLNYFKTIGKSLICSRKKLSRNETTDAQDKRHRCKCRCVHQGEPQKRPPRASHKAMDAPILHKGLKWGRRRKVKKSLCGKFSLEKIAPCNWNLGRGSSRGLLRKCNVCLCVCACWVTSAVSDSLPPYGLQSARLLGHLGTLQSVTAAGYLCWVLGEHAGPGSDSFLKTLRRERWNE